MLLDRALLAPPPAELASLSRLERLLLGTSAAYDLPAGPWQRSLRWLEASWPTLRTGSGLDFLSGCTRLQQLQIPGDWAFPAPIQPAELATPAVQRFLRWLNVASCSGTLRRLTIGFTDNDVGGAYGEHAALLSRLRSAASHRASVKVGRHWMHGALGEMVRKVHDAHRASMDRPAGPYFDEDEFAGLG